MLYLSHCAINNVYYLFSLYVKQTNVALESGVQQGKSPKEERGQNVDSMFLLELLLLCNFSQSFSPITVIFPKLFLVIVLSKLSQTSTIMRSFCKKFAFCRGRHPAKKRLG